MLILDKNVVLSLESTVNLSNSRNILWHSVFIESRSEYTRSGLNIIYDAKLTSSFTIRLENLINSCSSFENSFKHSLYISITARFISLDSLYFFIIFTAVIPAVPQNARHLIGLYLINLTISPPILSLISFNIFFLFSDLVFLLLLRFYSLMNQIMK